jgi:hypothetical protein
MSSDLQVALQATGEKRRVPIPKIDPFVSRERKRTVDETLEMPCLVFSAGDATAWTAMRRSFVFCRSPTASSCWMRSYSNWQVYTDE